MIAHKDDRKMTGRLQIGNVREEIFDAAVFYQGFSFGW
jgi:hypothetical protein